MRAAAVRQGAVPLPEPARRRAATEGPLALQRAIGNRAFARAVAAARPKPPPRRSVARAISIGSRPLPRSHDTPPAKRKYLEDNKLWEAFTLLNDLRHFIYIFESDWHMLWYIGGAKPPDKFPKPIVAKVSDAQLAEAHKAVATERFATVFQPSAEQIRAHAPGAHTIPEAMLPPPGSGHFWSQAQGHGGTPQFGIMSNVLQPPASTTLPLTYGNPAAPSLIMNQGGLNLGMYINPAPAANLEYVTRKGPFGTNYGGLPSEADRIRGHPFALEQSQWQTGPLPGPARAGGGQWSFDKDPRTYTNESDSTKAHGGVSTYRYNEVENPAIQNNRAFLQVNNNPMMSAMGVARPDSMYFRIPTATGYDDRLIDNTATTDYRNVVLPAGVGKQRYQTQMGQTAATANPYQPPTVFHPGDEYTSADARAAGGTNYPGSPPPTPFYSSSGYGQEFSITDASPNWAAFTEHTLPDGRRIRILGLQGPVPGGWSYLVREIAPTPGW
jgi:hypothetical protein